MIHYLNGMTCNARVPRGLQTGSLCHLLQTRQGLVLIDTGLGTPDYGRQPAVLRTFRLATIMPLDPAEAIVRQIEALGYPIKDVRHVVLTHLHFDHAGGVADFPGAMVHVHRREYEAFTGRPRSWMDLAYVRRHLAHGAPPRLYSEPGDTLLGMPAIRLPFEPAMWLLPLFGHTRGHCGVAFEAEDGLHLHAGDAAPIGVMPLGPIWFSRLVLGPHCLDLVRFGTEHPEVTVTAGHMPLSFFAGIA